MIPPQRREPCSPSACDANSVRIVIADDHSIYRRGLRNILERQLGWKVVAEVTNGKDAIEKVMALRPDIAVLDLKMPGLNGLEATRRILKSGSNTKILILSLYDSDSMVGQVLNAGAQGYLVKSDLAQDIIAAVHALQHNKTFFTSKVAQKIRAGHLSTENHPNHKDSAMILTSRQREILQLLAEGKSSKEVASSLNISVKTAETHRASIMRRLNFHSVSELVRYAVRNEIIEP
jgi:DNA-binding NarL/FixJ family response regulator